MLCIGQSNLVIQSCYCRCVYWCVCVSYSFVLYLTVWHLFTCHHRRWIKGLILMILTISSWWTRNQRYRLKPSCFLLNSSQCMNPKAVMPYGKEVDVNVHYLYYEHCKHGTFCLVDGFVNITDWTWGELIRKWRISLNQVLNIWTFAHL